MSAEPVDEIALRSHVDEEEEQGGTGSEPAESATSSSTMVANSASTVPEDWNWLFFPLLFLPPELIFKILGFLPFRDCLRARVNRTLREIETRMTHNLQDLFISCRYAHPAHYDVSFNLSIHPSEQVLAWLQKIFKNCSFKRLQLESGDVGDDVLDFALLHCKAPRLYFEEGAFANWNRKRIEESMEGRVMAFFFHMPPCITVDFLRDIFEVLDDGLDTLQAFFAYVHPSIAATFLRTLGMGVNRRGFFVSNNKSFKLFYNHPNYVFMSGNVIVYAESYFFIDFETPERLVLCRQNEDGTVVDHPELKPFHLLEKEVLDVEYVEEFDEESEDEETEEEESEED